MFKTFKEAYKEAYNIIISESYKENMKELSTLNVKLMKKLQGLGVKNLILTSLGNSIAAGYSLNKTVRPLLERNETIEEISDEYGINLDRYSMARAQNNNDNKIFSWVLNNTKFSEMHDINIRDYSDSSRCYMNNKGSVIMDSATNEGIADIIKKSDSGLANVIVYHGCTGSFLDNVTRKGIHPISSIRKDQESLNALLNYVQNQNRKEGTNTQVYLGGAPDFLGLKITNVINHGIKKKSKLFANTSYVKPVKSTFIYDTGVDIHYDEDEYISLNKNIIKSINDNYIYNMALIDIDRTLYKISENIELLTSFNSNPDYFVIALDEKIEYWFNYLRENKCDIKKFKNRLIQYFKENYPYDFFYIEKEKTIEKIKRA